MKPGSQRFDVVSFELIRNGLSAIADEMMTTLFMTGRSVNTTQSLDCSAGITDEKGQLLAQALALPGHLGTFPGVMQTMLKAFAGSIAPGDVYLSNDPFSVGLHMPDVVVVRPLFIRARLVAFALTVVHHIDIGGMAAGGMPTYASEVFHEGLRIPPLKLFQRGKLNQTLIDVLTKNVRVPDKVLGDLKGQAAACYIGQKRLQELVDGFGLADVRRYSRALLEYTEKMTRAEIRSWKNGTYRFVDHVDDDGLGNGPISIRLSMTVKNGNVLLDFGGTDPQVRGSINCPLHSTRAGAYTAIRCVQRPGLPTNAGFFRPIRVTAPLGSLVNPREPAATCNRALVLARVADVVFGALAQVVPDRTPACSESMTSPMTWSVRDDNGEAKVWVDNHISGRGGCPSMDAQEGVAPWVYNANNTSVEVTEANFPIRITRFGFVPSSGGPGKYRGGLSTYREFEVLAPEVSLTFRSDRRRFRPWGLAGGAPGLPSDVYLVRNGKRESLPAKFTMTLRQGDILHSLMQSGGGWGDPTERELESVLRDLRDGKIDPDHAREDYGVVVDPETLVVDVRATAELRRKKRVSSKTSRPLVTAAN